MSTLLRCAALAACLALAACAPPQEEKGVVAKVNGRTITLQQLEFKHDFMYLTGPNEPNPGLSRLQQEYGQALAELVVRELVAEVLEAKNLTVSAEELAKAEQDIRADYPGGSFEQVLVEEYIDYEAWRAELKAKLAMEKFFREVLRAGVKIDYQEAEAYYKDHLQDFYLPPRVRLILLRAPGMDQVEEATALYRKGDMAAVNARFGPGSAQELRLREDRLTATWRAALKNLAPGEAGPILSDSGNFSRLILVEHTPAKVLDPSRAYPLVEKVLVEEKMRAAFETWVEGQLAKADIRVTHLLPLSSAQGRNATAP